MPSLHACTPAAAVRSTQCWVSLGAACPGACASQAAVRGRGASGIYCYAEPRMTAALILRIAHVISVWLHARTHACKTPTHVDLKLTDSFAIELYTREHAVLQYKVVTGRCHVDVCDWTGSQEPAGALVGGEALWAWRGQAISVINISPGRHSTLQCKGLDRLC